MHSPTEKIPKNSVLPIETIKEINDIKNKKEIRTNDLTLEDVFVK